MGYEMIEVQQGTAEWAKLRMGMITASRFKDVMTDPRKGAGGLSATAMSYMWDLIGEVLTEKQSDSLDGLRAIEWGHNTEPDARAAYQFEKGVRIQQVGFCRSTEEPLIGVSPDGFVDCPETGAGGVEIKCPYKTRVHLQYMEQGGVPKEYKWQVHGQMLLTGRKWWDFVSYDPRLKKESLQLFVHREYADLDIQKEMWKKLTRFADQLKIKHFRLSGGETVQ